MFGNKITDLTQIAIGTVGYIIKIDVKSSIFAYDITAVQAQDNAGSVPAPVTTEVSLDTLMGYLNDSAAPDLAFNYGYGEVTIFLKTSVFPYVDTTGLVMFGKRNPIKLTSFNDKLDIDDKDIELFSAYVIKYGSILSGKPVPFDVEKTIKNKETEIKNANS